MSGSIDFPTLFFLGLAIVVALKLRSVLGRRTGDESTRYERYKIERASEANSKATGNGKVVTLPRREREEPASVDVPRESDADRTQRFTKFASGNVVLATSLIEIGRVDPAFEPAEFVKGARAAYEMIVTAFAEGNHAGLKDLLSPDVYEGFDSAIADRDHRKEKLEQTFVGIRTADLVDAELKAGLAQITMKFVCELISVTRSAAGEILSGDPKQIRAVVDIWTFARDTGSSNPNWRLVGTQAAG